MKPAQTPLLVTHHNGHTIIVEKETMKHVCTLEAWDNKEVTAELIVQAVNCYDELVTAIDEADTAFAVLQISDLTPQAQACVLKAWPLVMSARAKANPGGAYAKAVKEVQEHEITRVHRHNNALLEVIKRIHDEADHALGTEAELQNEVVQADLLSIIELADAALSKTSVPREPVNVPDLLAKVDAEIEKAEGGGS